MPYKYIDNQTMGLFNEEFEKLPLNDKGFPLILRDVSNGTMLEVYDHISGKIINKYKALDRVWYKVL